MSNDTVRYDPGDSKKGLAEVRDSMLLQNVKHVLADVSDILRLCFFERISMSSEVLQYFTLSTIFS